MKNKILIYSLLIPIIFFNHSSCGLLDEEKCINAAVFKKSWVGENRDVESNNLNFVAWYTFEFEEEYAIRITDVCPFGQLEVTVTIFEREGLPKATLWNNVPADYSLYIYQVLKAKHGTIRKLVGFEKVNRSKVSGVVALKKELTLDGLLENGPREYKICLSSTYYNLPEGELIEYQLKNDITSVDFQIDYFRF
jgi:hypothetical protein